MSLLQTVKGWFRREPETTRVEYQCWCSYWQMGGDTKEFRQEFEQHLNQHAPRGGIDYLRHCHEQAKAAYEKALTEQLAGLKDEGGTEE